MDSLDHTPMFSSVYSFGLFSITTQRREGYIDESLIVLTFHFNMKPN